MTLLQLIKRLSYREGDFTLSSGQKSEFYVDLKAATLHPQCVAKLAQAMFELLKKEGVQVDAVGGMTLGADPLATALSLHAYMQGVLWPAYIVRKEPKGHGTSQFIEGTENLLPQSKVVILEDVVTTGASSLKAIERVRQAGYQPVAVVSIVDRGAGGKEAFKAAGVPYFHITTLEDLQKA